MGTRSPKKGAAQHSQLWPMYCGQTAGWIKMPFGTGGGRPRRRPHCVTWGPSCTPKRRHSSPQFSAHVCCGHMAGWAKMPLGREVDWPRRHHVRWGPSFSQKGGQNPQFLPLWPNGWMDQDATWYGGRPRPRPHCVTWEPSSLCPPPKKRAQ